jgi:Flp pilus assembly protein TadG
MCLRRLTTDRGAAAVEFALVLPILLMLVFGIIDFGRAWNAQIDLTQSAREGVRVYVISGDTSAATTRATQAAAPLTGITASVTKTCPSVPSATDYGEVTVTMPFTYVTPLPSFVTGLGPQTITGIGQMRCQG